MLIFIHGIDESFTITKELLGVESMKSIATDQDLPQSVVDCVERNTLPWNKLASITKDGAKAFTGKNIGHNKLKEEYPGSLYTAFRFLLEDMEALCHNVS